MKKKQLFTMVGSLALVGAIGAGATLAYLSDTEGQLTNTFTMGESINIFLDEKNNDSTSDDKRVEKGNDYVDVLPGVPVFKDPTVTVERVGEEGVVTEQYVFMSVKKGSDVSLDIDDTNWLPITDNVDGVDVYYYLTTVTGTTNDLKDPDAETTEGYNPGIQLPPLFSHVTVDADVQANTKIDNVLVKAASVQKGNFTSAQDAYDSVTAISQHLTTFQ